MDYQNIRLAYKYGLISITDYYRLLEEYIERNELYITMPDKEYAISLGLTNLALLTEE